MKQLLICLSLLVSSVVSAQVKKVEGKVFEDSNKNGQYDKGEPLLKGITISNGRDLVKTNDKGEYKITALEDYQVFLIKPNNYQSSLSRDNKVNFYMPYESLGKVSTYNFPLYRQDESKPLHAVLLGDLQSDVSDDIHHVEKLVVSELLQSRPDLIFPLGDLVFDRLEVLEPLSKSLGLIGSPIYYVVGNHDLNFGKGLTIKDRDTTYKQVFGPSYYALEYGEELIIVLNNIMPIDEKKYVGKIDEMQKTFLKNVLKQYSTTHKKVKVMMHIPIEFMQDKDEFLTLFDAYEQVFVGTGHTHTQYHNYYDRKDKTAIHELVAGAVCGAWWQGPHDIEGIPFAMMYDGTWKGYWHLYSTPDNYNLKYKASGRDKEKQIQVWAPEVKEWDKSLEHLNDGYVYANVFAGDQNTDVQISYDGVTWQKMEYYAGVDPHYTRMIELQNSGRFKGMKISNFVDAKRKSKHLWRSSIPEILGDGPQVIRVKANDTKYGLNHIEYRIMWPQK